jgi:TetR/AcrR family transcriptional repressor of bet genes
MNKARARTGPRGDVKAFRRSQLIDATMRTIARHGFARTTMAHVAKAAGLSQGIVNFYFRTKEALLYETLEHLAEEYESLLQRALDRAGPDPVAALDAMIETDLGPDACTPTKAAVWLAFWAESRGRPKYRQLCRQLAEDYYLQVRDLCAALARRQGYEGLDVETISRSFNSMIDGLWVDLAIDPQSFDRERAKHACRAYFAGFFPAEFGPLLARQRDGDRRAG